MPAWASNPTGASSSPASPLADRSGHVDIHARLARRLLANQGDGSGIIDGRRSIGHADHSGKPSPRGRHRAGGDGFLGGLARFAQVHMPIDKARADHLARCIQPLDIRRGAGSMPRAKRGDASLPDQQIGDGIDAIGGIDDPTSNDKQGAHVARRIDSLSCCGKTTPGTAAILLMPSAASIACSHPWRITEHSMPARKYLLTSKRFAALEPTLPEGRSNPKHASGRGAAAKGRSLSAGFWRAQAWQQQGHHLAPARLSYSVAA
jgi:hypothetical protein